MAKIEFLRDKERKSAPKKVAGLRADNLNADTTRIVEETELGQSIKELNDDTIDEKRKVSGIDMRSRLHAFDISSILVSDALVCLGAQPKVSLDITGKKKRLVVSEDGAGRTEIKEMVVGKREFDRTKGPEPDKKV